MKLFQLGGFGDQRRHHRDQGHRPGAGLPHQACCLVAGRKGGSRWRLRGVARPAGEEHRPRAEQREGGHHPLVLGHQNFHRQCAGPGQAQGVRGGRDVNRRVRIMVSSDQLSLAIGKKGQNARLTSKLTGWHVDIEAEVVVAKGFRGEGGPGGPVAGGHPRHHPGAGRRAGAPWLHSAWKTCLQAEEGDLAEHSRRLAKRRRRSSTRLARAGGRADAPPEKKPPAGV